jgi:RNA polymerase subunit RPABC4/transcription elongation factor Spt4
MATKCIYCGTEKRKAFGKDAHSGELDEQVCLKCRGLTYKKQKLCEECGGFIIVDEHIPLSEIAPDNYCICKGGN